MAKKNSSWGKVSVILKGGYFDGGSLYVTPSLEGTLPFRVRDYYGYYTKTGKWVDLTPKPVTVEFPENFNGFFPK